MLQQYEYFKPHAVKVKIQNTFQTLRKRDGKELFTDLQIMFSLIQHAG